MLFFWVFFVFFNLPVRAQRLPGAVAAVQGAGSSQLTRLRRTEKKAKKKIVGNGDHKAATVNYSTVIILKVIVLAGSR